MYYALHEQQSTIDSLTILSAFESEVTPRPAWTQFQNDLSFGSLRWETSKLSSSAVLPETNESVPVHSAYYVSASTWHAEKHCLWQSAAFLETEYAPQ
jgi:hypothetical protein